MSAAGCHRELGSRDVATEACPACGHANLLHPSTWTNPRLTTCVGCAAEVGAAARGWARLQQVEVAGGAAEVQRARAAAARVAAATVWGAVLGELRRAVATRPNPGGGFSQEAHVPGLRLAIQLVEGLRAADGDEGEVAG